MAAPNASTRMDIGKLILAVLLPPLGVFIDRGCDIQFFINIVLTLLGYIPGIIHAIWVIFFYHTRPMRGPILVVNK